ncbi:hypothetical protein KKP04_14420 [Rhodomicrobium sp. Az07]|uniref:hypothetical protein n=1 Tax=Rhodomicrobium sp. Az07 TaxID=2839034 RepID=UPI001BE9EE7A|nr:hypothetical protein [Rhodomicrobium sp. Az07]MBT3072052.1 hypothetical protein [Rhodomicrobium sp. Az07]
MLRSARFIHSHGNEGQVTFENRNLEAQRQVAIAERQYVLADYIARRNDRAARSPGFPPHRLFCPTDRGPFVYRGRRTLRDGRPAIVLQQGDSYIVKPVTLQEAEAFAHVARRATLQRLEHVADRERGRERS